MPDVLQALCGISVTQSAVNQAATRTTAPTSPLATAYQQIRAAV
ncbi:hypothetical protein [Deinococcus taeanensis]|nr:hypothetical protein [Deinococcus taeanensis]